MKKFIIAGIIILAITLVSTYFYEPTSAKRTFIKKEHFREEIKLKVNVYRNLKEFRKAIKKRFPKQKGISNIIGFSVWNNIDNRCEIFVTVADRNSEFDTWGHELAHCMYGRWHKE